MILRFSHDGLRLFPRSRGWSRILQLLTLAMMALVALPAAAQQKEGFFRDVLINSGYGLGSGSPRDIAVAEGYSVQSMATPFQHQIPEQNAFLGGSSIDTNGGLLYPDGSPRFALAYSTGGDAHVFWTNSSGHNHWDTFYWNGGSYGGSCAGAFLTDSGYMNIFSGDVLPTAALGSHVPEDHTLPSDSPLLQYDQFDGLTSFSGIDHQGGAYIRNPGDGGVPSDAEVLLRYASPGFPGYQLPSVWAHQDTIGGAPSSGRQVVTGSHPEWTTSGEMGHRIAAAMIHYAIDGNLTPTVKHQLQNNQTLSIVQDTNPHRPEPVHNRFTKIGDKQYHHFKVEVPANHGGFLTIDLDERLDVNDNHAYHLNLYARQGNDLAFDSNTQHKNVIATGSKSLCIPLPEGASTWHVSVECATTVEPLPGGRGYSGPTHVLNGVGYDIRASWNGTTQSLSLVQPDGDIFESGQTVPISWDHQGLDTALVALSLTYPSGAEILLAEGIPAANQSFSWDIPANAAQGVYTVEITTRICGQTVSDQAWLTVEDDLPAEGYLDLTDATNICYGDGLEFRVDWETNLEAGTILLETYINGHLHTSDLVPNTGSYQRSFYYRFIVTSAEVRIGSASVGDSFAVDHTPGSCKSSLGR
ncbi:hypothetical protein SCOR_32130 [Sulfidibacter corallicola]|uniref:Uncharacterized protein n=1 Tax=Sulfidibacter corallicola TaxID=2818388 RepID=A0A8A4TIE0_SULCO|nr:GPI anchored serine-threonine rich family protein [Sulfidibacter corallicola]QTD49809.1 hypothetical protein J3U87_29855 [Sulfidibacter corallicola]